MIDAINSDEKRLSSNPKKNNIENNYENYDEANHFKNFKEHKYRIKKKIEERKQYIEKFIEPIIVKIKDKILKIKEKSSKEKVDNYTFIDFMIKLKDDVDEIKHFFEIMDFIEKKLISFDYNDYNLFIKYFVKYIIKKYEKEHIWKILINIYMIKIYHDLKSIKNGNQLSFINEKNYLYKSILEKILEDFKFEHLSGLYDYINFNDNFKLENNEEANNQLNYLDDVGKNESFMTNDIHVYSIVENNNSHISYDDNEFKENKKKIIEEGKVISNWNNFIEGECAKKQNLKIIYDIFDHLDDNKDFRFRKKFYKKLFEKISKENEYLNDTKFINSIMKLILKDDEEKYIFKILSLDEQINSEPYYEDIFCKIIMETTKKIENLCTIEITKIKEKKLEKEIEKDIGNSNLILNSNKPKAENFDVKEKNDLEKKSFPPILLLKLFGEYNNSLFNKIICKDLSYLNPVNYSINNNIEETDEQFIVIKKLFNLFIDYYLCFDLENIASDNLLIFFGYLTQCIIEYININDKIKDDLLEILRKKQKDLEEHDINKILKDLYKENKNNDLKNILFIIEHSLLFNLYCIKYLNYKNEFIFGKTLERMNLYFRIFLNFNPEIKLNDNIDKIIENKEILFESYKNNKFKNMHILFRLILLSYQIIFHLNIPEFDKNIFYLYKRRKKF